MKNLLPFCLILFLIIGICFACSESPANDTSSTFLSPPDEREKIYLEFIEAANSNDSLNLKQAILKHWSDTLIGENNRWLQTDINYWLAAYKEFGPLEFVSYGEDKYNENEIAWFKGKVCKDWIGLEFDFTTDHKIDGTNVLRSCSPAKSNKQRTGGYNADNPSELLESYFKKMEAEDLFSGVVLVAKGDEIIHQGAYGFSDKKTEAKCTLDQQMIIASTTKMFTAIAIAQLIQQEKLDLHTPISSYLADFPKQVGAKVTLAHLLTHTSGIELDDIDGFIPAIMKARSVDEFYKLNLEFLPQIESYENFEPLSSFDYSNENFDIMGKLIEQASGQNFYDYLSENIFKPLGMHNTGPVDMENGTLGIAKNYQLNRAGDGDLDNGFRDEVANSNLSFSRPAGSFYSTTNDLYAFMSALNNNLLIADSLKTQFTTKRVENLNIPIYRSWYGYGFYVNERNGLLNYGHAGGIPGGSSRCEYYPALDLYVIVVSNYNGAANFAANYICSELSKQEN